MSLDAAFFINSILLGIGLAMDAFSVSLADGLGQPCMKPPRLCAIAGVFATFQFLMPMLGWICVSTIAQHFTAFQRFIPWIALVLLLYIGGSMLHEGLTCKEEAGCCSALPFGTLLMQGVATSIDALSVGFTIADHTLPEALLATGLIGVVTFGICTAGLFIGKHAGTKLAGKAGIFGGVILILIGLEIFITSFF